MTMKKLFIVFLHAGSLALVWGCRHSTGDREAALQDEMRLEAEADAAGRLEAASGLVKRGDLDAAEETIGPLLGGAVMRRDAEVLAGEIAQLRAREAEILPDETSDRLAIFDVESRMRLPASYGQTAVEPRPEMGSLTDGTMETLVRKTVSMHVENASLATILQTLSRVEGLNLIADQALVTDEAGGASPRLTVHVDNLPLKHILDYVGRNMGVEFHVGEDVVWVGKRSETTTGPALETRVFRLAAGFIPELAAPADKNLNAIPAKADNELGSALKTFLADSPPGACYELYPDRNVLVVKNTREKLHVVEQLVQAFDREPRQVLIEARYITISQSDMMKLGFSLNQLVVPEDGSKVGFGDLVSSPTVEKTITTIAGKETAIEKRIDSTMSDAYSYRRLEAAGSLPGTLTLSGVLGNTTYIAVLDALKQLHSSKTLSVPRITVANNRSARIHRGTRRYYFEEYDLSAIDQGESGTSTKLVPVGKPKEIALGYQLDVKVNVGNDGETIMLALRPSINNISGYEYFDEAKLPILDENTLETTVVVKSGATVVLGGMMTKTEIAQEKSVPILGDIPVLGRLFRTSESENSPHHLLIFVNARVISSSGRFVDYQETATD